MRRIMSLLLLSRVATRHFLTRLAANSQSEAPFQPPETSIVVSGSLIPANCYAAIDHNALAGKEFACF